MRPRNAAPVVLSLALLIALCGVFLAAAPSAVGEAAVSAPATPRGRYVALPLLRGGHPCDPIHGESYSSLPLNPPPSDRPAAQHGDLNLALRSYVASSAFAGLVDINGPTDMNTPQLYGLFADQRTPIFRRAYQVYDWNWGCNCRGAPISNPAVTLIGLGTTSGETIHVPDSGYTVGSGYEVFVLYASAERITLKYTREDNVVWGYTIHIEKICVEPSLLALYQSLNQAGRGWLPVLRAGQAVGRAINNEIGVAIRDTGTFMDPRSRKDWWRGR